MRTIVAVLLLLTACGVPGPGSWRLTHTWPAPDENHFWSVAATEDGEAWAVADGGSLLRWDGAAWRSTEPPPRFHLTGPGFGFRTGPGGKGLWLVAGAVWKRERGAWAKLPRSTFRSEGGGLPNDLAVAGADEAWLAEAGDYGGWSIERWDGRAWTATRPPQADGSSGWVEWLAASGPGQAWAVQAWGGRHEPLRWEDGAWDPVPFPDLGAASCGLGDRFKVTSMVTDAPGSVWVTAGAVLDPDGCVPYEPRQSVVLRWTDGAWRLARVVEGSVVRAAKPDGEGGVWLGVSPVKGRVPYLVHAEDGGWEEFPLPKGGTEIMDLAPVPGTEQVWVVTRHGIYRFG